MTGKDELPPRDDRDWPGDNTTDMRTTGRADAGALFLRFVASCGVDEDEEQGGAAALIIPTAVLTMAAISPPKTTAKSQILTTGFQKKVMQQSSWRKAGEIRGWVSSSSELED